MKNKFPSSFRCPLVVGGLFLGLALLLCASARAQALLKNGDFESPFPISDPTAGWALVYQEGGPSDWSIAGQSTEASAGGGGRGAHLRASNINYGKVYFRQVVTNLTDGASYTLNILKMKTPGSRRERLRCDRHRPHPARLSMIGRRARAIVDTRNAIPGQTA